MADTVEETPGARFGFKDALRVGGVVFGGYLVLGLGLGILISSLGLPWWLAPLLSSLVYAGSVEFLLAGMIAASAPLASIAATTFLVNARHLVYGLSFPLENIRGFLPKFYGIYSLTDEQFALNAGPGSSAHSQGRLLWIGLLLHLSWISGSTLGAVVGASFLAGIKGMDFVMTALFIILAIEAYRAQKDNVSALLAVVSAAVAMIFFPDSMLTVALLLYVLLLLVRHFFSSKHPRTVSTEKLALGEPVQPTAGNLQDDAGEAPRA